MNMPFGKHKGVPVSELPISYARWACDNLVIRTPALAAALAARANGGSAPEGYRADPPHCRGGVLVMPFGKHRGTPVAQLPVSYCRWVEDEMDIKSPALRAAIEARAACDLDPVEDRFDFEEELDDNDDFDY